MVIHPSVKKQQINKEHSNRKTKRIYIEVLRIIAAFLVIVNHTVNTIFLNIPISTTWYVSVACLYISKIAVPIFLMISGALLLSKRDTPKKYLTRIIRCVIMIVLFTIINFAYIYRGQDVSFSLFLDSLFGCVTSAYWYLYLYLGILIMLPILQKLAQALLKKEIQLFLVISLVIGGGIPLLTVFTGLAVYPKFLSVLFSPYLGIMFLGYYIEKYVTITKSKAWVSSLIFSISILLQVLLTRYLYTLDQNNFMQLDDCTFLTITLSAACIYMSVKYIFTSINISPTLCKIISYVGGLTLGIYLWGDMFIRILGPMYEHLKSQMYIMVAVLIFQICIYLCGAVCTAVMKLIPYIKKLL